MKRVNEIFYTLQGEGRNAGRAAVFVRFAGCNLKCPFCDTDFASYQEMTNEQIVAQTATFPARFVVLTGGEPTLQVDNVLIDLLHEQGFEVAMETNGTHPFPTNLDWTTVSPKGKCMVERCNELKVVFESAASVDAAWMNIAADYYYVQPMDTGDSEKNRTIVQRCIAFVKQNPRWRLSLQIHKLAGFQ